MIEKKQLFSVSSVFGKHFVFWNFNANDMTKCRVMVNFCYLFSKIHFIIIEIIGKIENIGIKTMKNLLSDEKIFLTFFFFFSIKKMK